MNPAPRRGTRRRPELYATRGPRVAALLTARGRRPMPWQRAALDVALEQDERGRLVHDLVVWLVPRRAGKSLGVGGMLVDRSLFTPAARCWYTAQKGADASEWFRDDLLGLLEPYASRYKPVLGNGREKITWHHNGGQIAMFAPTRTALHSRYSDVIVLDESWAHDLTRGTELLQAVRPTMATRPGSQLWIVSAAGDHTSGFLNAQLETARARAAAGDPGICLLEHGVPDDLDATDPDVVAEHHPAVGHTISRDFLYAERGVLGASEFARAYGCWSPPAVAASPLDLERWRAGADPTPMPERLPVVIGFDVAPDRSTAIVAAAADPARPGGVWLDVIDFTTRPDPAGPLLRTLYRTQRPRPQLAADDAGPARQLVAELEVDRVPVSTLNARDFAAACAGFAGAVAAGRIRHRDHPALNAAVAAAGTRPLVDAWAFSRRRSTASISPLVAAAVAAWTLEQAPRLRPVIVAR